ncbi:LLM class flavin-dependent oxidoreductase [Conexibacter sp. SYSU D00693]|uniref:LLM class flavin-dependent oxidoreductase n=1 Tax=Conexibacter sp. SYSU D00693 TaxID=2812560 RepID=UPI00196B534E|nr:LLM class flavin-dependent oxidoreductase [Conexibacter sp. SYSU D00693]
MSRGCFVSVGRSVDEALGRVRLVEELGYDQVFCTHINGAESLTMLTAYAAATERVRVGTGVVPIYTRTPATMAQTAATISALSGGRVVLGLGVSHRPVVEGWHGQTIDRPVSEMREYVAIVRAILRGEQPPAGEKWQTGFQLQRQLQAPDLPIYVAALSPRMLRLAGEVADGVMLWLCNPEYVREVVVPEVRKGREAAGRTMEGFDVVAAVPTARVEDPAQAHAAMRKDLLPYFSLPFYRAMLERSGFGDDLAAFDAAAPEGPEAMGNAISTRFLDVLCAIGDEDQVRAGIARYEEAGATTAAVGAIAKTDFEAALRAAAGA